MSGFTASPFLQAAVNSPVAGAEDRATQTCDLSADPGAGIDRERAKACVFGFGAYLIITIRGPALRQIHAIP